MKNLNIGKSGKRGRVWTSEEEEKLRALWGYKTIPEIARILGRTETAIIVKYRRLWR